MFSRAGCIIHLSDVIGVILVASLLTVFMVSRFGHFFSVSVSFTLDVLRYLYRVQRAAVCWIVSDPMTFGLQANSTPLPLKKKKKKRRRRRRKNERK